MIHIPHSDHKRFENFKGFIESESKEKLTTMPDCEHKWQTEYWIAQTHIDNNKKMCSVVKDYYVKPRTKWDISNIDDQNYFANKLIDNKLEGFPSAYYVSLEESQERRDNLESQFGFYGISLNGVISKRFSECDDVVYGKYLQSLNEGTTGCVISHLKAIKEWYDTTDEEYGFFCEDDLSLETVDYWDFTWKEFINNIPEDADCVQMFAIRGEYDTFELRERYWDDWGASAYIVKRKYAKRLIDTFIRDDGYCLEIPNQTAMPLIENILFASLGKCYTIPLFVEEVKFQSTFVGKDDDVKDGQKKNHYVSQKKVLEWWKGKTQTEEERSVISHVHIKNLTLTDLFESGNYNTDKSDLGYLENFYDDFFIKLKESPITMMEIGVYNGGSIKLWKDYLNPESKIYAGDIEYFEHLEGTYSVIGDMYSDQQVSKFPNEYFDLIIDDGPHSFESFILLIQKYFSKIKQGGSLIVEDVIYTEWVEPLVKMAELIGYSDVKVLDMSEKQKTQELFDRWKGGLYILNITK
jgi:predicted RNA-binding protein